VAPASAFAQSAIVAILALTSAVLFLFVFPERAAGGRAWNAAVKLATAIACFLAYLSFRRGDYMRLPWAALGLDFLVIATRDALASAGILGGSFIALNMPQVLSNTFQVMAFVGFARAFRVAGLELPVGQWTRVLAFTACAAMATAIASVALARHVVELGRSDVAVIGAIASDIGDLVSFILLAPIFLTTVALRGGLLARPWFFLTASQVAWLCYDVLYLADMFAAREVARTTACACSLTAALAIRSMVVSSTRSRTL